MFALPIFMPHFKSIYSYQNIPKIMLFLFKNANIFCAGGSSSPPRHPALRRLLWGLGVLPPGPQNILPLRISGYLPGVLIAVILFCVNQFCGSLMVQYSLWLIFILYFGFYLCTFLGTHFFCDIIYICGSLVFILYGLEGFISPEIFI